MFLLLFLTLLKKEFNFLQFILILVSSAYIGGASESYSLIFISLMLMMFYALSKEENFKSIFSKRAKLKMGLALMFLLISLAITLSAPGNEIRLNALPSPPLTERLIIPFKSFAKLFLFKILPVLPYLIIFTSPWIILGNYFSRFNISNYSVNRYTIPFLFFIFIAILPTSIVMSETGPDRALSIISFSIVLFLSFQFYNFGYSKVTSSKYLNLIRIISAPAIFIIIAANTFTRGNLAAQYSKAYDERIAYLLAQKENTIDLVVVPALPASGYLYSAEVSADPNHFTNRFLVDAYNLNFKLSLKENE